MIRFKVGVLHSNIFHNLPESRVQDADVNNLFGYVIETMPGDPLFHRMVELRFNNGISFRIKKKKGTRVIHICLSLHIIKGTVIFKNTSGSIKISVNPQFSGLFF